MFFKEGFLGTGRRFLSLWGGVLVENLDFRFGLCGFELVEYFRRHLPKRGPGEVW